MKIKTIIITLLLTLVCGSYTEMRAEINFFLPPVTVEGEISEEAATILFRKTEQILTRNSAIAAGKDDPYAILVKLTVTDKATSSGLVREVTSISGEYTLIAIDANDRKKFHSVTVPLKTALKVDQGDPVVALAKSIKPTDTVYTRFIRKSREKIEKYIEEQNPSVAAPEESVDQKAE